MERSTADVQRDHMISLELNVIDQKTIWFPELNVFHFPLIQTALLQQTRKLRLRQMLSKALNKLSKAEIWRFKEGKYESYMNPNTHVGS